MYDSLSEKSKFFFHPGFLGFKDISFRWLFYQIILFLSTLRFPRKILLRLLPIYFLSLVARDENNNVVGFAFLRIEGRLRKGFFAELGIVVHEGHRGRGLGSKLMESLLKQAQEENILVLFLRVLPLNVKAIQLYERYGFSKVGKIVDRWKEKTFQSLLMKKVL
jgi:ribosomal protein S18 acetylase RimI-like enzyme